MPNRLANATSPYLIQHADNPVDWWEWGDEAFREAMERDVPVLLSVGYAACHWCHVMAHESFEDPETAAYMNEHFVNVKVDREERPDVDRIYMDAVQAMTGRGGWPMTVFLTPDGRPFFAGTYFPKEDRGNYPSFRRVMESVVDAWRRRRDDLEAQADRLTEAVRSVLPPAAEPPGTEILAQALQHVAAAYDPTHGGLGGAPKFPQPATWEFVLRTIALGAADTEGEQRLRTMLHHTLDAMARGGIYDQIGGGFARYSVDSQWLVPHFEKMLYDNAQLARLYLRAWQVLGDHELRRVAEETLDYMARDLRNPEGGFISSEDADSEGVEGKFYVWTMDELRSLLGADVAWAEAIYGVTDAGNFEGANILFLPRPLAEVAAERDISEAELRAIKGRIDDALRAARATRVRPGKDDKVVTAWHSLAVRAFAEAAAVLGDDRYEHIARSGAAFTQAHLTRPDGRLIRAWRDGRASGLGFADDHAATALAALTLFQVTGDVESYARGEELLDLLDRHFSSPQGALHATADDAEPLIHRPINLMDSPVPSEQSLAAEAWLIYEGLSGRDEARRRRERLIEAVSPVMARHPTAVGAMLAVMATASFGLRQVAVVGPGWRDLAAVMWEAFRPDVVIAGAEQPTDAVPLLAGRRPEGGVATAFVCREFTCRLPVVEPEALRAELYELRDDAPQDR